MKKVKLFTLLSAMFITASVAAFKSNAAISSSPVSGQSDTYSYTGAETTWTVPVAGYYDITCNGAQGGRGAAHKANNGSEWANNGSYGAEKKSRAYLAKGTVLVIHCGGVGKNGYVVAGDSCSAGDGGWNDGSKGTKESHWMENTSSATGAAGGGGGGSSYILVNGTKVISAKGGSGGDAFAGVPSVPFNGGGGAGGGSTSLQNAAGVIWYTSELNSTSENANAGNGKIVITYVRPYFEFTRNPASQTAKELGTVSLGVETSIEAVSLQWQVNTSGIWTNIKNEEATNDLTGRKIYSGSQGKTLQITDIPYEYNGNKYRCVAVYDGQTFISNEVAITVTSGLVFDEEPQDASRIEGQDVMFAARSSYAAQYGTFQWQKRDASGSWENVLVNDAPVFDEKSGQWVKNPEAEKYETGVDGPTLQWECELSDNNTYYRCVITTMDGKRSLVSNAACLTVVKKDFNKILAQYNREIEYGESLNIDEVYISLQYTNGKVDFASGWDNLYFLINEDREKVWTPDALGIQTIQIVFVDDSTTEGDKEYFATLKVTVVDTTSPEILTCDVSEHDVSNNPSKVQKITVTTSAKDLYTTKEKLMYALIEENRPLTERDYVLADDNGVASFELILNQNKSYVLYVKDENENVASKQVEVVVLDIDPPVIRDVYLLMQDKEWYSYNILKIEASDEYLPEEIEYRIGLSDEEIEKTDWQKENEFYIDKNGVYIIEVKDSVGNTVRTTYQVNDIDSTAPVVEGTVSYDFESDAFLLSAVVSDADSGLYTYRKQNGPLVYIGDTDADATYQIDFDAVKYEDFKNSIVLEVTDKAGNTNFYQFIRDDETYSVPTVTLTRVTEETGEWLDHVIIKAEYSLERGSVSDKPYSFVKWDGDIAPEGAGTWTGSSSYSVTSSGTWRCYVKTTSGAVGYADIVIGDVDANPPEISFEALEWNWSSKKATLHYNISDTDSGIAKITMQANSLEGNKTYDEFYGMYKAELEQEVTLYANAVYSLYAYDIAGHESVYKVSCSTTGQLVQNPVTVIFTDYDNAILSTQIIVQGGNATAPGDPSRNGYIFKGWDRSLINIQEDTTIKALYTAEASDAFSSSGSSGSGSDEYTVSFVDYDGVTLKTQKVKAGESASAPSDPSRSGYIFRGWNNSYRNIKKDTTCTAVYEKTDASSGAGNEGIFLVTFKDYNGVVLDSQSVNYGKAANAPENPVRAGYIFKGWDKAFSYVTSDITVTAVYESDNSGTSSNIAKTTGKTGAGGTGGSDTMEGMDGIEEELNAEEYISVALMQVNASALAVDNGEYGILAQDGTSEDNEFLIEKDSRLQEITQEKLGEEEGNKKLSIGFWLTIILIILLAGFAIFYNLNRKHVWVRLPDIPFLNFDLPFAS